MIPKNAKDKAFDGGWLPFATKSYLPGWQAIALDQTFWQCLGKALGWEHEDTIKPMSEERWIRYARHFYDLILTGGNIQAFWNDLLKDREPTQ